MRWSLFPVGLIIAFLVAVCVSVMALTGGLRELSSGPLYAEVKLNSFTVPKEFHVDRNELTDGLLLQIRARAETDVGLRMALDELGQRQLKDLIIPRLVNPSVVARVIENVPALRSILDINSYQSVAEVKIVNNTDTSIEDVVFMAPSMIKVEDAKGAVLSIVGDDKTAKRVRLGSLAAHETQELAVWFSKTVPQLLSEDHYVRVGAADGLDGTVYVFGDQAWPGEDLEILPWSRWIIGFVVIFAGVAAAALLFLFLLGSRKGKRTRVPMEADQGQASA